MLTKQPLDRIVPYVRHTIVSLLSPLFQEKCTIPAIFCRVAKLLGVLPLAINLPGAILIEQDIVKGACSSAAKRIGDLAGACHVVHITHYTLGHRNGFEIGSKLGFGFLRLSSAGELSICGLVILRFECATICQQCLGWT